MLGDMAGEAAELLGQLDEIAPGGRVLAVGVAGNPVQLARQLLGRAWLAELGDLVELRQRQAERLADIAHGAAQLVGGKGADQSGVFVPELLVDPLDQPLANLARKIEIDIGNRVELFVQEATEEEVVRDRIDMRETDQIADDRADRRSAPASRRQIGDSARALAPAHFQGDLGRQNEQIPIEEKEPGQLVLGDDAQLFVDPPDRLGFVARIANVQLFVADLAQVVVRRRAVRRGVVGEDVGQVVGEIEFAAAFGDFDCVRERRGPFVEELGHLFGGAKVELTVRAAELMGVVQGGAVMDGDQHVLQPVAVGKVVMDIPGGDVAQAQLVRQPDQGANALDIAMDFVVLQLDEDRIASQPGDVLLQQRPGGVSDRRRRRAARACPTGSR